MLQLTESKVQVLMSLISSLQHETQAEMSSWGPSSEQMVEEYWIPFLFVTDLMDRARRDSS